MAKPKVSEQFKNSRKRDWDKYVYYRPINIYKTKIIKLYEVIIEVTNNPNNKIVDKYDLRQ